MNFVESLELFHVAAKEIPCLTGKGAPTGRTEGAPGVLYMDTDTGDLFKCRGGAKGRYRWEMQGDSGASADLSGAIQEALIQAKESGEFDGRAPVKGVDYYTEADKAEIVAMVLDALGGQVISGYVDAEKNIVLSNLAVGSYAVGYLMEDGSFVKIADFEVDGSSYYSVTNNLTNCVSSNGAVQAAAGGSYSAAISAYSGYELESVVVTMGGADVSADVVSGGAISIASVTGDVVITAVAVEAAVEPGHTNLLPRAVDADGNDYAGTNGEDGYKSGYRISASSGNEAATDGVYCTGFMPVTKTDTVYIKNITLHSTVSYNNIVVYDASKARITGGAISTENVYCDLVDGVYRLYIDQMTAGDAAFFRFSAGSITDETIVTVNEEIV